MCGSENAQNNATYIMCCNTLRAEINQVLFPLSLMTVNDQNTAGLLKVLLCSIVREEHWEKHASHGAPIYIYTVQYQDIQMTLDTKHTITFFNTTAVNKLMWRIGGPISQTYIATRTARREVSITTIPKTIQSLLMALSRFKVNKWPDVFMT